ncbi:MAG: hypothetical protein WAK33_11490 [Silvibacterium sp.]
MTRVTRHLAYQEQRYVTELHGLARLDRKRRDLDCLDPGDELTNPACALHTVFVELVLPEHAGKHGTPKSLLRRDDLCWAHLVRPEWRKMNQL